MSYYPRIIERKIKELSEVYPVVVLCGPRQSGKSTLVKSLFTDYEYTNLEDLDVRSFAEADPRAFLEQFEGNVIIDEVQNVPTLFSYIQVVVDSKKIKGQFILTGSSQLDLIEGVSQSLAGRATIFELLPLSLSEIQQKRTVDSPETAMFYGGYPNINFDSAPVVDWYLDYIRNYIERDVRKILNVKNLGTFQLFLKMCASRCGEVINYSSFTNDCGISVHTVKEWMNILEASFIIYRLPPYYRNYSKRLVKSSKLYFYDTGVLCSLLGITSSDELITHSRRGGIFESWAINEIKKSFYNIHRKPPLYFWRDNKGVEVDLVIERLEKFDLVEIKSSKTIGDSFFKNLDYIGKLAPEVLNRCLIYGGEKNQTRSTAKVVSWQNLDAIKPTDK